MPVLARIWLALRRWTTVPPSQPMPAKCVLIAAPHTSNWDFPITKSMTRVCGIEMTWLGKAELFRGPMGPIMRAMGGIPVERMAAAGMVPAMVAEFARRDTLVLTVPVEGTRSKGQYWKSGFYRIAMEAGVPIVCGYVDGPRRTGGFGPTIHLTGDVRADMDRIREFYAGKEGLRPALTTTPRLRDEDAGNDGSGNDD